MPQTIAKIPLITISTMTLCVVVYLWQILWNPLEQNYTINARSVLYLHQYYRFLTGSMMHGSIMHIGMNMMSFATIGSDVEKQLGSLWHLFTILWSILLTCTMEVAIAYGMYVLFGVETLMDRHYIGFSAVLFHLLVVNVRLHPNSSYDVFGMLKVSAKWYPWISMLIIQILLPNVSFVGHLAGILCGYLQVYGLLNFLLPSAEFLSSCDRWERLRPISSKEIYVNTQESTIQSMIQEPTALRDSVMHTMKRIWKFLRDVLHTIRVILFGHSNASRENENIRFGGVGVELGNGTDSNGDCHSSSDDDESVTRPPKPDPFPNVGSAMV